MSQFDIVIVGAGIAGVSLAYRLADRHKVLILERESHPAYHSTGRSAAMFMQAYGPPGVRALTRASHAFLSHPPIGFCDSPLLAPRGSLVLGVQGQEDALQSEYDELQGSCPGLRRLSAAQCVQQVPVLQTERLVGGVLDPNAMEVDVHNLHQGFLKAAKTMGAQLRCNAELVQAQAPTTENPRWQLELDKGEVIECQIIVNASGAWGDVVAQRCGVKALGLTPKRRSAFTFTQSEHDATGWPLVSALDESFYFKPDAGQLLGSPANADPCPPHDVVPEELDIAMGIAHIEEATTLSIRRPSRTWAGLRTFAPVGEPVVGYDPQQTQFFWLVGQGGYGIQTCAALSELAAWELQAGLQSGARKADEPQGHLPSEGAFPADLSTHGLTPLQFAPLS